MTMQTDPPIDHHPSDDGAPAQHVYARLNAEQLVEAAVTHGEGQVSPTGAIAVVTGEFTGRSPRDKYVVEEHASRDDIWWGTVNHPLSESAFDTLLQDVQAYLAGRDVLYTQELAVGADAQYQYPVDLTTERAWVALFARHLFIIPDERGEGEPITVLHAPGFHADPERHGVRSSTVITLHLSRRIIIIAGTEYGGEVKKSVFTMMQYLLPKRGVVTMHCSANVDQKGGSTLFFGLSGTGKTTLSNDAATSLVGDDEHGWSDEGIFNLEGGCYAKTIALSNTDEPRIYAATQHSETVLENVPLDPASDYPDFDDSTLTENTRAAFSVESLPNCVISGMAPHPSRVIFLTADAAGVLPPVARLTREQAIALFLLGFTSKVAGTERGLTAPEATFSECFGSPFLPLPPEVYADLLAERIATHAPSLWLVNTGWTGGSFDTGKRISITHTRAIVSAITRGDLHDVPYETHPVFGLEVPTQCPDVPDAVLRPRETWVDPDAYDQAARELHGAFRERARTQGIDPAWTQWLG